MLNGKRIVVVMPAYNAEKTLKKTYDEIPQDIVDCIILTDDHSSDNTVHVAKDLKLKTFVHDTNLGYGGNQKTCYREALKLGADVVVMLHPDYQYPPKLITPMAGLITCGMFDVVLGSRILGNKALKGGMPVYKYIANRILTLVENNLIGEKLSEYHTGYRAFSRDVLLNLPILEDSDDFVFDNQLLLQAFYFGYRVGEITCPAVYTEESSSINFRRSVVYGLGVLGTVFKYMRQKHNLGKSGIFDKNGRKIKI
ncbi:MAG: glycosyl transferase family 2 [Omnitrophica bacterium RIFCSPLOWO2_02_FULL_45_16]|nr:MAG: glycosyl transferase family 2 [Omnitrophica bacterium RIFCSPLOWO2_01_FULL_45_24]OGW99763.1 MAG: glycosyl transferase family 2 [Omnitrophica bacterium RIFCSPLOWO2_02_FULL_45_16]